VIHGWDHTRRHAGATPARDRQGGNMIGYAGPMKTKAEADKAEEAEHHS
jgi:hypothetical protein